MFTEFVNSMDEANREAFYRATVMAMDTPEAAAMRVKYYRSVLRRCGENVHIGVNVRIVNPQFIELGNNVQIHDGCVLIAHGEGGIVLDDSVRLQPEVYLNTENAAHGYIHIGGRTYIGARTLLYGHRGLEIGKDCLLAQNVTITPASHTFDDPDKTIYSQPCDVRKIVIGDDCYLGMGVKVVCYAETIGKGAVIGAGALVTHPVRPGAVCVGIPAREVRNRSERITRHHEIRLKFD